MKRYKDSGFFDDLIQTPWWVSAILSVLSGTFFFLIAPRFHLPDIATNPFMLTLDTAIHTPELLYNIGWVLVLFFMTTALFSSCKELWNWWNTR